MAPSPKAARSGGGTRRHPLSPWLAPSPGKRWTELFFLAYSPSWIIWCLCILVPFKIYEVSAQPEAAGRCLCPTRQAFPSRLPSCLYAPRVPNGGQRRSTCDPLLSNLIDAPHSAPPLLPACPPLPNPAALHAAPGQVGLPQPGAGRGGALRAAAAAAAAGERAGQAVAPAVLGAGQPLDCHL